VRPAWKLLSEISLLAADLIRSTNQVMEGLRREF
jgi:hypothetical protein